SEAGRDACRYTTKHLALRPPTSIPIPVRLDAFANDRPENRRAGELDQVSVGFEFRCALLVPLVRRVGPDHDPPVTERRFPTNPSRSCPPSQGFRPEWPTSV